VLHFCAGMQLNSRWHDVSGSCVFLLELLYWSLCGGAVLGAGCRNNTRTQGFFGAVQLNAVLSITPYCRKQRKISCVVSFLLFD